MSRMRMTKADAIRLAKREHSGVYRAAPGVRGWGFKTYDNSRRAWWLPRTTTTYVHAVSQRAESIAARAAHIYLAHCHPDAEIEQTAPDGRGVRVEEQFDRIVEHEERWLSRRSAS